MREVEAGASPYSPPVDRLLTLGDAEVRVMTWRDYGTLGIQAEHITELVRMATDQTLHEAGTESSLVWAPVHAWRALGQMRAHSAISPLLELLGRGEPDDTMLQDLPRVFAKIGSGALSELSSFLFDSERDLWSRITVADAVAQIAAAEPDRTGEVIAILTRQLSEWYRSDESLNAFIISALVDLGASETAPLMKEAFEHDRVDVDYDGDWEDVQVRLGLLSERRTEYRHRFRPPFAMSGKTRVAQPTSAAGRKKARKKIARQTRKRNRRKR